MDRRRDDMKVAASLGNVCLVYNAFSGAFRQHSWTKQGAELWRSWSRRRPQLTCSTAIPPCMHIICRVLFIRSEEGRRRSAEIRGGGHSTPAAQRRARHERRAEVRARRCRNAAAGGAVAHRLRGQHRGGRLPTCSCVCLRCMLPVVTDQICLASTQPNTILLVHCKPVGSWRLQPHSVDGAPRSMMI